MNNQIDSLYSLIKQKSQEKGRPLKIVCDWDECLQPLAPHLWYLLAKEKGWTIPNNLDFKDWLHYFWENVQLVYIRNMPRIHRTPIPEVEELRDVNQHDESKDLGGFGDKFQDLVSKPLHEIMNRSDHYVKKPFLSIADDLLLAFKEDLASEFVVVSSTIGKDNRKKKLFKRTFDKLPLKKHLHLNKWGNYTRTNKKRADWIKEEHSDFDIFIDDSPTIIKETMEVFANSPEKIYCLPDYKFSRELQDSNVYHVKTTVSDLKEEDFIYKVYKKQPTNPWPWIIGGALIITFLIVFVIFLRKLQKRKSK